MRVTVVGSGFTGATNVQFGSAPASSYVVANDNIIEAVSPPGSDTVEVTVTTPGGTSGTGSQGDRFSYVPVPVVTNVNPNFLTPGQSTVISGSGFTGASEVAFGGVSAASFTVNSDAQITAVIPQGTGTVDVTVTSLGGTSAINTADRFTYVFLM